VVAQLCAQALAAGATPEEAVRRTLAQVSGAYALAFVFEDEPDLMIAARPGSPLAIGYGSADATGGCEMFVGSDALALAGLTDRLSYLADGDMAVLTRDRVVIRDQEGLEVTREIQEVPAESWVVGRAPFRHFMAKEIHEQPESLARALRGLVDHHALRISPLLEAVDFSKVDRVILVACGTAHHACHIAKYWLEGIAGLPVEVEIASEFRYRNLAVSGA